MNPFSGIPFFRILIPFVAGILIGIKTEWQAVHFSLFILLFTLITLFNFYKSGKQLHKIILLICADIFLFCYGINLAGLKNTSRQQDYYGNLVNTDSTVTLIAVVNDLPVQKNRFIKCDLKLLEVKSGTKFISCKGSIYGYFRSAPGYSLEAGQTLLIRTKLLGVDAPKNPFEFDYRNYLYNKQVYHTAFIDPSSFVRISSDSHLSPIWATGLACKKFIITRLKNSSLSENAYTICSALITGYDDEIDRSVMEAFSHSGTLHVLSVSGLHTGLIYLALTFLFDLVDKKRKYKRSRLLLMTIFLWFFALITGFSAPVLRAVIMFNLLGLGKLFFRAQEKHQVNILLVSAFILLLYNPFYITDIGFLLSYFALFGLIYFQPGLSALWRPESKLLNSGWQSITASVAATVSTLPLTLFYFKQFPLWFFVCNIVVVPATFVLLFLALCIVLKLSVFSFLINGLVRFLIWFINLFNSKDFGFIDTIHFTLFDALFLAIFIILLSVAFQFRSYKHMTASLILLLIWQCVSIAESFSIKQNSLLTVYNVKHRTAVSVKNKTTVALTTIEPAAYNFSVKPHLTSFNYPAIQHSSFNMLKHDKQNILFLNTPGYWPDVDPAIVTTLVISNDFKLKEEDLKKFKNLEILVADASNNNYRVGCAQELSRNFGIRFYSTKAKGAYILQL